VCVCVCGVCVSSCVISCMFMCISCDVMHSCASTRMCTFRAYTHTHTHSSRAFSLAHSCPMSLSPTLFSSFLAHGCVLFLSLPLPLFSYPLPVSLVLAVSRTLSLSLSRSLYSQATDQGNSQFSQAAQVYIYRHTLKPKTRNTKHEILHSELTVFIGCTVIQGGEDS